MHHTPDDPELALGPETSPCPGCGVVLPAHDGPTHRYLGASAACWALYGRVMAREFNNPAYSAIHQMSTDTYAVQHPGVPERRTIQSAALHLMTCASSWRRARILWMVPDFTSAWSSDRFPLARTASPQREHDGRRRAARRGPGRAPQARDCVGA
jgi:hypothetical protein